ncbi:MAG: RNA polymerase sigma-70 factor [Saprospiraceae bacterium]
MQKVYTDQELKHLFDKDAAQAIELLFRLYYGKVCQAVYKIIPKTDLTEDLAQEVFYELWRKKDQIFIQSSYLAYLRRAAINKALNYLRDQKIKLDDFTEVSQLKMSAPLSDEQLNAKELQVVIDQAVDLLPERCRLVFVLSRFEQMSYQEIADQMGISIKTVENQVSKALKLLRIALGPYLPIWLSLVAHFL